MEHLLEVTTMLGLQHPIFGLKMQRVADLEPHLQEQDLTENTDMLRNQE